MESMRIKAFADLPTDVQEKMKQYPGFSVATCLRLLFIVMRTRACLHDNADWECKPELPCEVCQALQEVERESEAQAKAAGVSLPDEDVAPTTSPRW